MRYEKTTQVKCPSCDETREVTYKSFTGYSKVAESGGYSLCKACQGSKAGKKRKSWSIDTILSKALKLQEIDRATLAKRLLESLGPETLGKL